MLLLLSTLTAAQTDQLQKRDGFGAVRGQVVDGHGRPVEGAVVSSEPTDGVLQGIVRNVTTNENGEFFLDRIPAGDCMVLASKVASFYPDARFAFFGVGTGEFPIVHISAGQTIQDVIVRLLQKGARLSGAILDAGTGKPVVTSRIRLMRQDPPHLSFATSPDEHGRFDLVVPIQPFVMEVSAPCYRTWSPGSTGVLLLQSESVKEESIKLQREEASACNGG
jgi:hypothetical protein